MGEELRETCSCGASDKKHNTPVLTFTPLPRNTWSRSNQKLQCGKKTIYQQADMLIIPKKRKT